MVHVKDFDFALPNNLALKLLNASPTRKDRH
jgi:hypothetical protein